MKKTGTVYKGKAKPKADVTLIMADDTFVSMTEGKVRFTIIALEYVTHHSTIHQFVRKLDGQKAYMTGKLKTKGNMMMATKLDGVLKVRFTL